MIKLAGLFSDHLNLNGDFGNLRVLDQQLNWRAMPHEIVSVEEAADLIAAPNFILIGHGSEAAWADIEGQFLALIPRLRELLAAGATILAVSTGFEMVVKHGLIAGLTVEASDERISKFATAQDDSGEVLGYVNTDTDLPTIYREGSFIGTTLHGPLLAKNPNLLESILAQVSTNAGVAVSSIQDAKKADLLAGLVAEVWKLEVELANE
jgi:lipid II isoglutaminyl synthase (glutamine-hydrolysing)